MLTDFCQIFFSNLDFDSVSFYYLNLEYNKYMDG